MNTIIYTQGSDTTSSTVMDWLNFYGANTLRLNAEDFGSEGCHLRLELSNTKTERSVFVDGVDVLKGDINRFWLRRDCRPSICGKFQHEDASLQSSIQRHLTKEARAAKQSLFHMLDLPTLGDYFQMNVHKTELLLLARNAGLKIPATMVTSRKSDLLEFMDKHVALISKPLVDPLFVQAKGEGVFASYTEALDAQQVQVYPDKFFPSLFQEEIPKAYELRVFYLDAKCYPMAIFSQLDQQTAVDFRKYNTTKSNRRIPYKLPDDITKSLQQLMSEIKLDTGSIDIIRSTNGDYVFLEVNPVGQFGMVSKPCNYYLEEKVAQSLMRNNSDIQ